MGRNVKSFHWSLPSTCVPVSRYAFTFPSLRTKRVVRVLPESSELLHAAPKYATADNLCFTFCISVTHPLQKPTSEVLLWITGGNQTEINTRRLDSAAELVLKILRKVQSKLLPVIGWGALERSRTDNFSSALWPPVSRNQWLQYICLWVRKVPCVTYLDDLDHSNVGYKSAAGSLN